MRFLNSLLIIGFTGAMAFAADSAVEQAQGLAVKKNRVEACAILRKALQEPPPSLKARAKIAESLNQISRMFFTDKGQKTFEAGQATLWDSPDVGLNHFREALVMEDQNVQILEAIARGQLIKQECDNALTTTATALKINPLASEAALLELRAYVCKQDFENVREKARNLPAGRNRWQEDYLQYLLGIEAASESAWRKVSDANTKIIADEPQFSEAYWWRAKAAAALGKENEADLQKYVSLCKAITVREKKKFALEPRPCANQKEAEDELAKAKTPEA